MTDKDLFTVEFGMPNRHRTVRLEGTSGNQVVIFAVQSKANVKVILNCSGPCPVEFWLHPTELQFIRDYCSESQEIKKKVSPMPL